MAAVDTVLVSALEKLVGSWVGVRVVRQAPLARQVVRLGNGAQESSRVPGALFSGPVICAEPH